MGFENLQLPIIPFLSPYLTVCQNPHEADLRTERTKLQLSMLGMQSRWPQFAWGDVHLALLNRERIAVEFGGVRHRICLNIRHVER
jgi:hypothetical protein